MFRSPVRDTNAARQRTVQRPMSYGDDDADFHLVYDSPTPSVVINTPTLDETTTPARARILELVDNIIRSTKASSNIKATLKADILKSADEIQKIVSSGTYEAPSVPTDPGSLLIVRQAVREELTKFKLPDQPTGPAISKPLEEGLLDAIRQGIRAELKTISAPIFGPQPKSYAATARAPPRKEPSPPQRSLPSIIIKTTETGDSQPNVLDEWRKKVSFRDTNFAPTKVKPLSKNVIRVDFDKKEHCTEAIKRVNAIPGIQAENARKKKPLVILKGINKEIPKEELIPILSQQNTVSPEDMRFCFALKNRNEQLYNVVLEVHPTIRRKFVEAERVNIEHQRVRVADFSRFVQCYKCLQFGHTNNKCKADYYPCSHCASTEHSFANCPQKTNPDALKCINCHRYNEKTNSSVGTKHSATNSKICSRINTARKQLEETIDYGY